MLSTKQIQEYLDKVTYKPGWKFRCYDGRWEGQHLVITTVLPDAYDKGKTTTLDVHSMLPPMETIDQLNTWMMWRLGRIEIHEMREFYQVDGKLIADPHAEFAGRDLE